MRQWKSTLTMVTHANCYCLGFAVWIFIETNEDTGIGNV